MRILYGIGILVSAGSAAYVLYVLAANEAWQIDRPTAYALGWRVAAGALVYALSSVFLGAAWWRLLDWAGEAVVHRGLCHGIYGRAQLAKYIPGNVFSFVGRQVLGRRAGFSHWGLAAASILEIVGQISAAGIIGLIGYQSSWTLPVGYRVSILLLAPAGVVASVFLAVVMLRKLNRSERPAFLKRTVTDFARLALIFGLYIPFFVIGGTVLWLLVGAVADGHGAEWTYVLSISAAAWLLGFVVPGAPGGIGVRDAFLIVGLTPVVGGFAASAATIAFRIVTVLGDILYFLISHAFPMRAPGRIED